MSYLTIILTISIGKILEYYAILCLVCMPLNLILLIFLSKRTNLMQRIDNYIDKKFPLEKKVPEKTPETAQAKPQPPVAIVQPTDEQIQQMSGISCFEILVGETYRCHLNYQNRGGSYGEMVWFNDNEFVGEIKDNGVFKAAKVGVSNIFCVSRGHAYDAGAQAYCIKVVSAYGTWFVDTFIEQVKDKAKKSDILAKHIRRKILRENPHKRIIAFAGLPAERTYSKTVQFSQSGELLRGCYSLHNEKNIYEDTVTLLNERFDEIKLKVSDGYRIWVHQIIDNEHEEVDIYAFLKETNNKELILGIGQTWREYGEKEEFTDNINMAIRLFQDIINQSASTIEILKEQPEQAKQAPQNAKTPDTPQSVPEGEQTPAEQTDTEPEPEITTEDGPSIEDFADFTEEELNENQ